MCKSLKNYLLILFSVSLLLACGDSDAPQEKATAPATEATAVQLPAEAPDPTVVEIVEVAAVEQEMTETEIVFLPNQVVYQEEIYKDWPYTDAPVVNDMLADASEKADQAIATVKEQAQATMDELKASAEEKVAAVVAPVSDKPYQVTDGKISANAMEGWKTYNGGGCGACHGRGGMGAVAPNLGDSVTKKLSKEEFVKIVANGVPSTLMRSNKTNKRVMDNLDNLYAYLVARGDGILGPENLIKFPFGKNE
jgi:mono/diheme cytochrome c family protein